MNLINFFEQNSIVLKNGVYVFKNRIPKNTEVSNDLPRHSPKMLKDIKKIFNIFQENNIQLLSINRTVLVAIIVEEFGYSESWSYTIAGCIHYLLSKIKEMK